MNQEAIQKMRQGIRPKCEKCKQRDGAMLIGPIIMCATCVHQHLIKEQEKRRQELLEE